MLFALEDIQCHRYVFRNLLTVNISGDKCLNDLCPVSDLVEWIEPYVANHRSSKTMFKCVFIIMVLCAI